MVLNSKQIVWTPVLSKDSLAVALDSSFASACAGYKGEDVGRLIEGAWRLMGNPSPIVPTYFIQIQGGILPKGFYSGRDGLWLAAESTNVRPTRPFYYHGHNEDRHSSDILWLMRAFGAWAAGAMTLLNWE